MCPFLLCFSPASLSCFWPVVVCLPILSWLPSQLQELSVCEQKQPRQFVVSSVQLHLHHVPLPLLDSLWQDTSSPGTVSSMPMFPPPQAGVNVEYVKSAGAMKLSVSHCIFLSSEKAGGNKRGGKSSQETKEVFPDKVWKEVGSQWGSGYVWALFKVWKSPEVLVLFFSSSFSFYFLLCHQRLSTRVFKL